MKRLSWKYMAGLIDGEGCIDMQITHHKNYPETRYMRPRLRITLAESCRVVLDVMKTNHGGNLQDCSRKNKNPIWQDSVTWQIEGKRMRSFLQNIANHLILKKEQARLAIWILDNVIGKHVTNEAREHLIGEMKAMKRDPHRLSEMAIRDFEPFKWSKKFSECIDCGTNKRPHMANGRCAVCHNEFWREKYRVQRVSMRQSGNIATA